MLLLPRSKTRLGLLAFDGVASDSHRLTITATDQPLSSLAVATDHAHVDPRPLRVEVIATRSTGSAIPSSPNDFNPARVEQLYQSLLELARLRVPILVVTSIDVYRDMLIRSVDRPRSSRADTNRARIAVELREVLLAEVVPVANIAEAAVDVAAPVQDLGSVSTETAGGFVQP